jgi:hypothetical protein
MTPNIDHMIGRPYCAETYHCGHTARDAWEILTGEDLTEIMPGVLLPPEQRKISKVLRANWVELEEPVSPCVVVFRKKGMHVGVYWKGSVIHIARPGVVCFPLHLVEIQHGKAKFFLPESRRVRSRISGADQSND